MSKDMVNHPSHYETGKFECIEVMLETQGIEAVQSFCICNAFKYLYRNRNKNGLEDIKKAIWYLNKYVELVEGTKQTEDKPTTAATITTTDFPLKELLSTPEFVAFRNCLEGGKACDNCAYVNLDNCYPLLCMKVCEKLASMLS